MIPDNLHDFLGCETPQSWLDAALVNIPILLLDHANCEKKAASQALGLMFRYAEYPELTHRLSRLAREELRHFEQVQRIIQGRKIEYQHVTASRYASGLREHIRHREPGKLVDTLIVGAFIEARSCERFESVAPLLDPELSKFYLGLCASEARHFGDYLKLAMAYSEEGLAERIGVFRDVEQELITGRDREFRFHSGIPT